MFSSGWKAIQAFRAEIIALVTRRLIIKHEPRPQENIDKTNRLVKLLYGDAESKWLQKRDKQGNLRKSRLLADLESLAEMVDLGLGTLDTMTFWVYGQALEAVKTCGHGRVTREACIEAFVVPILNVLVGRAWDSSSVSRWAYVSKKYWRIAVGCLINRLLPESLTSLQLFWQVNASLEGMLAKLVAADSGDYSARTKLRLLRITRCFTHACVLWQIAIIISASAVIDELLYGTLGDSTPGSRFTLRSLLDEVKSPISDCQQILLEALLHFCVDRECWLLFRELGGDFSSRACKCFARRHCIQVSGAVLQYFEIRMSGGHYPLIKLLDDGVERDRKRTVCQRFLDIPEHCLSLIAFRIRQMYGSIEALLRRAPIFVPPWAETEFIAIDFAERSHATMRLDVRSTGPGRNFVHSANRIQAQQLLAEHLRRGGQEPSLAPLLDKTSRPRGDSIVVASAQKPQPKKSSRAGLNPKMECQNHKLATYKQFFAADRTITTEERDKVFNNVASEWNRMSAAQQKSWQVIYRSNCSVRAHGPLVATTVPEPKPFVGMWRDQISDINHIVPLHVLRSCHSEHSGEQRRSLAQYDPKLFVHGDVPRRVEKKGAGFCSVFGCHANKKNLCRHVMPAALADSTDTLCALLSAFVGSLGAHVARLAETLVWLQGTSVDNPADILSMVCLLCDPVYSPKMQFWGRCCLLGQDRQHEFVMPDAWPVVVSVSTRVARLSPRFRAVDLVTSDELAHQLASAHRQWQLHTLEWDFRDGDSLLDMVITGATGPFVKKVAVRQKRAATDAMDAEIGVADPRGYGIAQAMASSHSVSDDVGGDLPHTSAPDDADAQQDFLEQVVAEAEAELCDGLGEAAMQDIGEAMLDVMHRIDHAADDFFLGDADRADVVAEAHDSDAEEEEAIIPEDPPVAAPPPPLAPGPPLPIPPPTLEECLANSKLDGLGYISLRLAPWDAVAHVGRITDWPASREKERMSVGCKCYVHPACNSPAKTRQVVTDAFLKRWLFHAKFEAGASKARIRELGVEHRKLFQYMFAEHVAAPVGSGGQHWRGST